MADRPWCTADLCDAHGEAVRVAQPLLRDYGGRRTFGGPVSTVRAPDDNSLVRAALEEPGRGRVLVVDGGGSRRCALLGDRLAALAAGGGWAGVVVHGCVRDARALAGIELGVKALATCPRRSVKLGAGERDVPVAFAGLVLEPGCYVYCDEDGLIAADAALEPAGP